MYIIQKALYNRDNIPVYYDYCLITLWKLKNRKSTPQDVNNSLLLQSLENLDPNLEDESFECGQYVDVYLQEHPAVSDYRHIEIILKRKLVHESYIISDTSINSDHILIALENVFIHTGNKDQTHIDDKLIDIVHVCLESIEKIPENVKRIEDIGKNI